MGDCDNVFVALFLIFFCLPEKVLMWKNVAFVEFFVVSVGLVFICRINTLFLPRLELEILSLY